MTEEEIKAAAHYAFNVYKTMVRLGKWKDIEMKPKPKELPEPKVSQRKFALKDEDD